MKPESTESGRMLLVIDPQIDFISGALPVPGAEAAMDALARHITTSDGMYRCKIITADRHPYRHLSFLDAGGQWPRHCVHDTVGAAILPAVFDAVYSTAGTSHVLHKGQSADREEYSIFQNEAAAREISRIVASENIGTIDICGLAGDVCVLSSLRDGIAQLPDIRFNVLTEFSPSLDGGDALRAFIAARTSF